MNGPLPTPSRPAGMPRARSGNGIMGWYPYHPNGRGFEEYYGLLGHWGITSLPLDTMDALCRARVLRDDFTDKAMAFMERSHKAGKPFFAYLPYNAALAVQVRIAGGKSLRTRRSSCATAIRVGKMQHLRCALAMCENID